MFEGEGGRGNFLWCLGRARIWIGLGWTWVGLGLDYSPWIELSSPTQPIHWVLDKDLGLIHWIGCDFDYPRRLLTILLPECKGRGDWIGLDWIMIFGWTTLDWIHFSLC